MFAPVRFKVPSPALVRVYEPLMMPDKLKLPETVIVLLAPRVILPEMAPLPVLFASVPPDSVIGSRPMFAWMSKVPPATVVPELVPPKALP